MPRSSILLSRIVAWVCPKQIVLAKRLHVHTSTVGRWKSGKVLPPIECIDAIANLLLRLGAAQGEVATWVAAAVDDHARAPLSSWITTRMWRRRAQ